MTVWSESALRALLAIMTEAQRADYGRLAGGLPSVVDRCRVASRVLTYGESAQC